MRALVTGATGFIGRRLVRELSRPVVLSRKPEKAWKILGEVEARAWEPVAGPAPAEALDGVEVVFNLLGEPVAAGRWTKAKKQRIFSSRVEGAKNLVKAIEGAFRRPRVLVSASAIGYYGSRGDEILEEASAPGSDFLAEVCKAWEAEARRAESLGVRVAIVRVGLVLGSGGGFLPRMLTPFRLGLGGRLGDGRHWMSWIHLDDIVGLLLHAAQTGEVRGPMNGVGPAPVTNAEFTRALARVLHRPAIFPVPTFALRAAFGELSEGMLASQRVVPRVAEKTGYRFKYGELEEALRAAI